MHFLLKRHEIIVNEEVNRYQDNIYFFHIKRQDQVNISDVIINAFLNDNKYNEKKKLLL